MSPCPASIAVGWPRYPSHPMPAVKTCLLESCHGKRHGGRRVSFTDARDNKHLSVKSFDHATNKMNQLSQVPFCQGVSQRSDQVWSSLRSCSPLVPTFVRTRRQSPPHITGSRGLDKGHLPLCARLLLIGQCLSTMFSILLPESVIHNVYIVCVLQSLLVTLLRGHYFGCHSPQVPL